jgi:hypothetical protein
LTGHAGAAQNPRVKKPTTLVLVGLMLAATTPAEGQDDTLRFRWSISGGPSDAIPSGREVRLVPGGDKRCFGCSMPDQLISGAADGQYHASVAVSGDVYRSYVALRMEGTFNRATTRQQTPGPVKCAKGKCTQRRKASRDDAYLLGFGVEGISPAWKGLSSYVVMTGGISINKLGYSTDTVTFKENGDAIAFGPYVAPGVGIKYQALRKVALYTQWRFAKTFFVPGSSMTPISIGLLYSASLPNYGY